MTADRYLPIADEDDPDGPSRLRKFVAVLFLLLFAVFMFEVLDGVERAAEQAERRENVLRSACRDPAWTYATATEEAEASEWLEARAASPDPDLVSEPVRPSTTPQPPPPTTPATPVDFTPDGPAQP